KARHRGGDAEFARRRRVGDGRLSGGSCGRGRGGGGHAEQVVVVGVEEERGARGGVGERVLLRETRSGRRLLVRTRLCDRRFEREHGVGGRERLLGGGRDVV